VKLPTLGSSIDAPVSIKAFVPILSSVHADTVARQRGRDPSNASAPAARRSMLFGPSGPTLLSETRTTRLFKMFSGLPT